MILYRRRKACQYAASRVCRAAVHLRLRWIRARVEQAYSSVRRARIQLYRTERIRVGQRQRLTRVAQGVHKCRGWHGLQLIETSDVHAAETHRFPAMPYMPLQLEPIRGRLQECSEVVWDAHLSAALPC
eukprot:scaffold13929_cov97-Isochrysis_galbana.AAC.7